MNTALDIRPTQSGEAARISQLAKSSKRYWGYPDEYMQLWDPELTYSEQELLSSRYDYRSLWLNGDTLGGFYSLAPPGRDTLEALGGQWPAQLPDIAEFLELDSLFVHPDCIGRGSGAALLRHAMQLAGSRDATGLVIQSEPKAQDFYARFGAVRVGEIRSQHIQGRALPILALLLPQGA